ncbi:MAG: hypothetical protein AB1640_25560 [bacterium]
MDERAGRIVYVSGCLLNQNLRFPGIALRKGAFTEVVDLLLRNEVGIAALPCLERDGWGGVTRKTFFRFQPRIIASVDARWFPCVRLCIRAWLWHFARLCRARSKAVAAEMEDFVRAGGSVLGVVAMDDSPTCGVTKTIDLLEAARILKRLGWSGADLDHPDLEKMKRTLPALCSKGQGIFMREVWKEMRRKGLAIPIVGFDPWGDSSLEVRRIAQALGLRA